VSSTSLQVLPSFVDRRGGTDQVDQSRQQVQSVPRSVPSILPFNPSYQALRLDGCHGVSAENSWLSKQTCSLVCGFWFVMLPHS